MIHKIERLISIGKFRNYQAKGDVTLKKLTLIYADNGSGKTTLTSVFRSLTQNNREILAKRISINNTDPQSAQIIQRDSGNNDIFHTLKSNGWSNKFPNIDIFDIHFVNENIYSGFDFNDEHKKQLHQFVIGAQGVKIKQEIENNKNDKSISRQKIDELESNLLLQVGNGLNKETLTSFISLREIEIKNIESIIEDAENALSNAKANAVIKTLQPLSTIGNITSGIDFEAVVSDLSYSLEHIQNETLKVTLNNHCNDLVTNSVEDPETWIKKGFNYLETKTTKIEERERVDLSCPFCQQIISSDLDIIKAYSLHFNESFNSLVLRIQSHLSSLPKFNLEAIIQTVNNSVQANSSKITSWSTHLPHNVSFPDLTIIKDEETLKKELTELMSTVQRKSQNPSVAVSIEETRTLKQSLDLINENINTYNLIKTTYNEQIYKFLENIQTEVQAQNELNKLKRIKMRFEQPVIDIVLALKTEKQTLKNLEKLYTQLISKENLAALSFFSIYKDKINFYLSNVFKTPFRIEDIVHQPPKGKATQSKIGYKLTLNGCDISFDSTEFNSAKECFSEGDKSTIALAFFLAKIDIDPNLEDKILVFDDPLSSLDRNRRLSTVQLLKDLLPRIKQIIVLSHNEFFLSEISKNSRGEKKTLRIFENFVLNSSNIEPIDLDTLVEIDYFKHLKELEGFLSKPDLAQKERVIGLMRNILEAHICFKFYRQIRIIPDNARTFGKLIDELEKQRVTFRSDPNPSSVISQLRLINSVSCKPHHGEPEPDYKTIGIDPETISDVELANLIKDTLELIDTKL